LILFLLHLLIFTCILQFCLFIFKFFHQKKLYSPSNFFLYKKVSSRKEVFFSAKVNFIQIREWEDAICLLLVLFSCLFIIEKDSFQRMRKKISWPSMVIKDEKTTLSRRASFRFCLKRTWEMIVIGLLKLLLLSAKKAFFIRIINLLAS